MRLTDVEEHVLGALSPAERAQLRDLLVRAVGPAASADAALAGHGACASEESPC